MKTLMKKAITKLLMPIIKPLVKTEVENVLAMKEQTNKESFAEEVKAVLENCAMDADYCS